MCVYLHVCCVCVCVDTFWGHKDIGCCLMWVVLSSDRTATFLTTSHFSSHDPLLLKSVFVWDACLDACGGQRENSSGCHLYLVWDRGSCRFLVSLWLYVPATWPLSFWNSPVPASHLMEHWDYRPLLVFLRFWGLELRSSRLLAKRSTLLSTSNSQVLVLQARAAMSDFPCFLEQSIYILTRSWSFLPTFPTSFSGSWWEVKELLSWFYRGGQAQKPQKQSTGPWQRMYPVCCMSVTPACS